MIKYFKELLITLKNIEKHLETIAACVKTNSGGHGDKKSLSVKHWNDKI
jgi:hypothetical protein